MHKRAHEIVQELRGLRNEQTLNAVTAPYNIANQNALLGELSVLLAEEADKQSRRLVWLTWAIVLLTAVIVLFTVAIYQDARAQHEHAPTAEQTNH